MQCPRCKRFADKYVEHDFVVLFIDLVLVKPQVSRLPFWCTVCHDPEVRVHDIVGFCRSTGISYSTASAARTMLSM